MTDDILSALDKNLLTTLVLLDYSKAFDRISHRLLFATLHYIGFSNNAVELIKSYITGRSQIVKYKNEVSTSLYTISGVPQGSILGPLLFSVYTSSFKNCLTTCKAHFYADDTQIYLSYEESKIQEANNLINIDLHLTYLISQKSTAYR